MKWHINKMHEKIQKYNALNAMTLFKESKEEEDSNPYKYADCVFPTTKFFQDNKTEIFEMDAACDRYEIFESMRIYIERFGRPYNYLKSVSHLND